MRSKVAFIKCPDYEEKRVFEAIEKGIGMLGGWESFLPEKEEKLLLKPNMLSRSLPEKAATTHPAVFGAAADSLIAAGYKNIKFGDSPGNHLIPVERVARECGIYAEGEKRGLSLADFEHGREMPYEKGRTAKSFIISEGVLEADRIVNICKLKSHMLERMTGAVKNSFGLVYGFNKGATHVKFPNADSFACQLADLNNAYPPSVHIMDAVIAMEGNGPQSGTPREMGYILISGDPVALDTVACRLISLDPMAVLTNTRSEEYGVGTCDEERIDVITEDGVITPVEIGERYGAEDFDVYRGEAVQKNIKQLRPLMPFIEKRPVIDKDKCVACGICVKSCPVEGKAVDFRGGKTPKYDYKKCIRCYCCQEMCPKSAISVRTPWLGRLLDRELKI